MGIRRPGRWLRRPWLGRFPPLGAVAPRSRSSRIVSRICHLHSVFSYWRPATRVNLQESVIRIRHNNDMAALAPFIDLPDSEYDAPLEDDSWLADAGIEYPEDATSRWGATSAAIEQEIAKRNQRLARETEISPDIRFFVDDFADQLSELPAGFSLRVDPYFLLAAQQALIGSLRALDSDDPGWSRRQMRVRLEQLRQVYRDLAEGEAVYGDRPAKEVARWLAEVLDVSQARLAELIGVSPRTFQRWISLADSIGPEGDDARRLRLVALAANHLRHALTGPGVVQWFEWPHVQLDGRKPRDLLDDPEGAARLASLAASTRSHTAS